VAELFIMNSNDQNREHPSTPDEDEIIRRLVDEMERFERLSNEDRKRLDRQLDDHLELLCGKAGVEYPRERRQLCQARTPEEIERFQRDFAEAVFRSLEPEHQVVMRQFAASLPLPATPESLRQELADARERASRISSTLKQRTGKTPRIKRPRPPGKMLTIAQMAERLNYSKDAVYQMAKDGAIPGCKAFPTSGKKKKSYRADAEIFERWRTSPDRRVKK
jgi:excisionase family DNA binding protein